MCLSCHNPASCSFEKEPSAVNPQRPPEQHRQRISEKCAPERQAPKRTPRAKTALCFELHCF
eukprot:5066556-Alexandrium_andersonii.AAC.1